MRPWTNSPLANGRLLRGLLGGGVFFRLWWWLLVLLNQARSMLQKLLLGSHLIDVDAVLRALQSPPLRDLLLLLPVIVATLSRFWLFADAVCCSAIDGDIAAQSRTCSLLRLRVGGGRE